MLVVVISSCSKSASIRAKVSLAKQETAVSGNPSMDSFKSSGLMMALRLWSNSSSIIGLLSYPFLPDETASRCLLTSSYHCIIKRRSAERCLHIFYIAKAIGRLYSSSEVSTLSNNFPTKKTGHNSQSHLT